MVEIVFTALLVLAGLNYESLPPLLQVLFWPAFIIDIFLLFNAGQEGIIIIQINDDDKDEQDEEDEATTSL